MGEKTKPKTPNLMLTLNNKAGRNKAMEMHSGFERKIQPLLKQYMTATSPRSL